jgi:ferredoxin
VRSLSLPATLLVRPAGLSILLSGLQRGGYQLIGPTIDGSAIAYRPIDHVDDLPRTWSAEQAPGHYRLLRRGDDALFAFGPPADSLKRYLCPPSDTIWVATREHGTLQFARADSPPPRLAVIGARPCDLQAIARLDEVFLRGPHADPAYRARRASMVLVAANCVHPSATCFCASMGSGPRATDVYDLALTELPSGDLLVDVRTAAGADAVTAVEPVDAPDDAIAAARDALDRAADHMGRRVETSGLASRLAERLEHEEWDEVAHRCLACANCTMVCPTCFCHTVDDLTDLSGVRLERRRRWDTCFSSEFTYIHGGSIRSSVRARYRQWLTHKFLTWAEQFGAPGCVGCGRCITWCPAGIDVTEEIHRLTE